MTHAEKQENMAMYMTCERPSIEMVPQEAKMLDWLGRDFIANRFRELKEAVSEEQSLRTISHQ